MYLVWCLRYFLFVGSTFEEGVHCVGVLIRDNQLFCTPASSVKVVYFHIIPLSQAN